MPKNFLKASLVVIIPLNACGPDQGEHMCNIFGGSRMLRDSFERTGVVYTTNIYHNVTVLQNLWLPGSLYLRTFVLWRLLQ